VTELTMAELAQSQIAKREAKAEQNRRDFPYATKVKTMFEDANPIKEYLAHPDDAEMTRTRVKVVWAEENGKRIGRVPT